MKSRPRNVVRSIWLFCSRIAAAREMRHKRYENNRTKRMDGKVTIVTWDVPTVFLWPAITDYDVGQRDFCEALLWYNKIIILYRSAYVYACKCYSRTLMRLHRRRSYQPITILCSHNIDKIITHMCTRFERPQLLNMVYLLGICFLHFTHSIRVDLIHFRW